MLEKNAQKEVGIFLISYGIFYFIFGLVLGFDDSAYLLRVSFVPSLATALLTATRKIQKKPSSFFIELIVLAIIIGLLIDVGFGSLISMVQSFLFGIIVALIIHSFIQIQSQYFPLRKYKLFGRCVVNFIIACSCAFIMYFSLLSPATTKEDSLFLQGLFTLAITLPFITVFWTIVMAVHWNRISHAR